MLCWQVGIAKAGLDVVKCTRHWLHLICSGEFIKKIIRVRKVKNVDRKNHKPVWFDVL